MKLSNFKLLMTEGKNSLNWVFIASVDVETGMLWWKKKEERIIRREHGGFWYFVETGKFTPFLQAEELARSWTAKTGQKT